MKIVMLEGSPNRQGSSNMLAFVTPLYYYGMSVQLKVLVDRFCALNGSIQRKRIRE